jgi:uncharacterized membrane protein
LNRSFAVITAGVVAFPLAIKLNPKKRAKTSTEYFFITILLLIEWPSG